ncbi:hypothetical protein DL96DRAFT_1711462 [Flagelloscypha sp. PMI_526]|nr:hypothetical protein DL96DRAFT_1711462 [Flagelloscypha sp. PMI_526]
MDLGCIRISNFPAELQGSIWKLAAWGATKPEQAQLSLICKAARHWTQDVLYQSIHAENALLENLASILNDDRPPAVLFRRKTQSLWLVSPSQPDQVLCILRHLRNITRLFIETGSSRVAETLHSIATLPYLKEVQLPPHYFYLVPFSRVESTLLSSPITHLIVPTNITTEVPDMYLWTSFPKLTHLVVLITAVPEDDDFEVLCTRSPENLLVLDRTPPHVPGFAPNKRFSRTPIIIRASSQRDWVFKKLWNTNSEFWDAVDHSVQEAIKRKEDGYFIEMKEW